MTSIATKSSLQALQGPRSAASTIVAMHHNVARDPFVKHLVVAGFTVEYSTPLQVVKLYGMHRRAVDFSSPDVRRFLHVLVLCCAVRCYAVLCCAVLCCASVLVICHDALLLHACHL